MSTRPTPKQWEILLDAFESNPEMVSGRASGPNAKHIVRNKWESLATQLNSLGYTNKPVEKWIKTWTDFKSALKKKAAELKREQTGTGGGPPSGKQLTSYEERALKLLGSSFIGLNMPEAGLEPPQTLAQSQLNLPISVKINDGASTSWQDGVCSSPTSVSTSSVPISPISTKPRVEKRQISTHEHSYVKQRKVSVEDTYVETIDILKNMDTKLESIDQKLGSIADSLKIIAEKM